MITTDCACCTNSCGTASPRSAKSLFDRMDVYTRCRYSFITASFTSSSISASVILRSRSSAINRSRKCRNQPRVSFSRIPTRMGSALRIMSLENSRRSMSCPLGVTYRYGTGWACWQLTSNFSMVARRSWCRT
uniref:(northern house mosquito) hypothetical protein n=1 Tax=Culex pipiens TaxID=7175 RepID=A0A8D8ADX2_CULPI